MEYMNKLLQNFDKIFSNEYLRYYNWENLDYSLSTDQVIDIIIEEPENYIFYSF